MIIERIENILDSDDFELSTKYLCYIHESLFRGIFFEYGRPRKHNISKEQDILNGDSVDYPDYHTIYTYLKFAFDAEKRKNYDKMNLDEMAENIASICAEIWWVHPFGEGNTRTISVFTQKYLNYHGFKVDSAIFRENAEYFRNCLVKASYENEKLHVEKDILPLTNFLKSVITNREVVQESLMVKELFGKRKVLTKM